MPKSTLHVHLPGFSTLHAGLSGCVLLLRVRSFVSKATLLQLILWHWIRTRCMQLCLTPLHKMCSILHRTDNGAPVGYCTPTWNFSSIWQLLLLQSTAHSTLHSLKCGIMPCVSPQTMHCLNIVTCLASLFLFFHINKIHLVNAPTEWCITNAIGIIKALWCHRLTNQLSHYIQRQAVSGPINFRTSTSIFISRNSTNLRTRQLWDINMSTTALHSLNQPEKWPRVWEMFHGWYRRLLRHTRSAHIKDNMQRTDPQQLRIYISTDDHWFAKHWRISEFNILY